MSDDRQYAPATLRNRDFILDVLRDVLPTTGVILEIASGAGKHVVHCARNLPSLVFQPSDPVPGGAAQYRQLGEGRRRQEYVRAPNSAGRDYSSWPIASANGIICINMVHISPWDATVCPVHPFDPTPDV
jgi:hypothetical protein